MMKRNTRVTGCTCQGYPWAGLMSGAMHRRGSLWCWYRANGEQREPGDPDFRDRNLTDDEIEALAA
ncbi:hypothetical protein ACLKMY_00595 [Paraburkholderia mimosarum]|uniref:hypothetical protein n=1 Tax=Paraburkholderia mimosarum TaxID=312026 RepID=UPI0039C13456